ncbi:TniB family NTP-binding protein [Paraburkholderia sp. MMS20-SJTR3]|uniref:TniB family NTP-binding protein n=1 Tax=Paraburkholderia sejongensis TaxID=2886946 RepID=A0ABS8K5H5_9BURK|nr:TniB family NTP-binding protein [Paraburkholderia sp. MMS20-SJTR3]MCC8397353.1 TniB family NTP-binding protein [Paraburkholderia sp. MMS20-SJTR3]
MVGTDDAVIALQSDTQMVSRFTPFEMPRWRESETFRRLLSAFARILPLCGPSDLAQRKIVRYVLAASDGLTGEVAAGDAAQPTTECFFVKGPMCNGPRAQVSERQSVPPVHCPTGSSRYAAPGTPLSPRCCAGAPCGSTRARLRARTASGSRRLIACRNGGRAKKMRIGKIDAHQKPTPRLLIATGKQLLSRRL